MLAISRRYQIEIQTFNLTTYLTESHESLGFIMNSNFSASPAYLVWRQGICTGQQNKEGFETDQELFFFNGKYSV